MRTASILMAFTGAGAVAALIGYWAYVQAPADSTLRTSGIIEAREVNLSAKIPGTLTWVCCDEGDRVHAGQQVFRLGDADLQAQVEEAKAGISLARANVAVAEASVRSDQGGLESSRAEARSAEADLNRAQAQLREAGKTLRRNRELQVQKAVSRSALDAAETDYQAAQAAVAAARARLLAAQAKVTAATAQLDAERQRRDAAQAQVAQANAQLAYAQAKAAEAQITSPLGGVVVLKAFEAGETIAPGQAVLTINELRDRYARVDIDEGQLPRLALGARADLTTEGNPGISLPGRVTAIGRYGEFATQTDVKGGRQDIRTFKVKISFHDPAVTLKPGMTVRVAIQEAPRP
jgi:multidrug resistance efflux pump